MDKSQGRVGKHREDGGMTRCLALGCQAQPQEGLPLCARHWKATPHYLHAYVLDQVERRRFDENSRLVLSPDRRRNS